EGAESLVIAGAMGMIRRHMPVIHWEAACSIDETEGSHNCRDTLALLDGLGYRHILVLSDATTRAIGCVDDLLAVGYDVNVISVSGASSPPPRLDWPG
ncbi:MAG: hypothetical protein Q7V14_03120, partial [Coriobacteriia bacterium]|nr:hypothetical protein [Coriobacteriia bacterium]